MSSDAAGARTSVSIAAGGSTAAPRETGVPEKTMSPAGRAEPSSTDDFLARVRRAPPGDDPPLPHVPGVTILEPVGRGGTGIVYRARDVATGRDVAVKVFWGAGHLSSGALGRASREAEILGRLRHPNIVRILDTGECAGSPPGTGSVPYLTMEWVAGGTLAERVGEAGLPQREAVRIVRDLALALAAVHDQGIVHRDIKPANVLLEPATGGTTADAAGDAPGPTPKLADFGLARGDAPVDALTQDGAVLGTLGYLAPEQVGGTGAVGPATDIHGLGATLYFLLTGRPPYAGPGTIAALVRVIRGTVDWSAPGIGEIHPDLRTVLEKCLEPDPRARYASARDLAADLDRILLGQPIRARRPGLAARCGRVARRHPLVATAALVAAAAVVVAVGWAGVQGARAAAARRDIATSEAEVRRSATIARRSQDLARESLARFTDDHFQKILARGEVLDEESRRLLAEVRDAYLRWPTAGNDRDEAGFRATGLRRVAGLLASVGRTGEAAETYAEARGLLDEVDQGGPGDAAWNAVRLDALVAEYRFLIESARAADAEPLVARAVALLDGPLEPPATPQGRGSIALDRGFVLSALGRHEEGAEIVRGALAGLRAAREARPDDPDIAGAEHSGLWNASICAAREGRPAEQAALLHALVNGAEDAIRRFPQFRDAHTHMLLLAAPILADIELAAGNRRESRAIARGAVARARTALASRPDDLRLQGDLIEAAARAPRATEDPAELAEDAAALSEGIALAEGIMAREPAVFSHVHRLFMILREQARMQALRGDHAGALATRARMRKELVPWRSSADYGEMVAAWSTNTAVDASGDTWRAGDQAGTIALLEEALETAPPALRSGVLTALAHAAISSGDRERGRAAAEEAIRDPDAADKARRALERLGE
jgi:hypothetical protein